MSVKTITINEKQYKVKKIDFNAICELEELGFTISNIKALQNKPLSMIRACFAFHSGLPLEFASKEIEAHLENGGAIDDFTPFIEAINDSDFFAKMAKNSK